ncbi:uncharacterized protein LOC122499706 [Leptopilina heterotoma]|uniref:uncharacterized protein LOC122499706 n=1 Tax=Leptopilina heterotoma TaxID=63436 RepID=UPI001CA9D931|nr:uncharacterized protein LOC122499706 [Leptopilina heterotoma]
MEDLIEKHDITSNNKIYSFTSGDTTIVLTGLIVLNEETKLRQNAGGNVQNQKNGGNVQNNNRPDKYILDNLAGRKRRILVWPKRIAEFEGKLVNHVIRITRGKVMNVNAQYFFEKDGFGPVEILVVDNTIIEIL